MAQRIALVVVGAGGFGQEVVWAARNANRINPVYDILGYVDDDARKKGAEIYGCRVLGTPDELDFRPAFVCAIGDNEARRSVATRLSSLGWSPAIVIDPSVIVAEGVAVGEGTYVGAGSILSPNAHLGNHVIINHHCSIGHDSILGDFVTVSPGGRVSGGCRLEEGAMLASNAVLAPGRSIGRYSKLSACSFALVNIPDGATAVGNPARVLLKGKGGVATAPSQ